MMKAIRSLFHMVPLFTLLMTPAVGDAASFNEDLYSFQMQIDGEVITLPSSYEQMINAGWTYSGDGKELLKPEDRTASTAWEKNGVLLYGEMFNTSWDVAPVEKCVLASVQLGASDSEVLLPGGILPGISVIGDVADAYGTPSGSQNGGGVTQYTYHLEYDREVVFSFSAATGVLQEVSMRNVVMSAAPDPKALAGNSSSGSAHYHAPSSLGEDPFTFYVSYGNALYALPAPVSEFLKNGWIAIDGADSVVKAYGSSQLTLMLNGEQWTTWVYNHSDKATLAVNCMVTTIVSDMQRGEIPLVLPGGVAVGMTEEAALSIYGELTAKASETGTSRRYVFSKGKRGIVLSIQRSTGLVSRVEVNNAP